MTPNTLFDLLDQLESAKIHYTLSRNRPDTVLVSITVVGMRVEVDVFRDGHTEVCIFRGTEEPTDDANELERIIEANRD
ncbi:MULTISPECIES: hypothetical protein [unclassified Burkholderia]|uniref:hypothetical protein n=1 Tax=unclassified Burkholderia TaxID=2613784 RepID=UPI000F57C7FC|nr:MULTISPECIES: hypothetical protein [unclassified Burkholderia]RQR44184.1 hypothetical protein DIE20_08955 [Burkholderia sp. Bp9131]RQR71007.1 hypothetical protein DIE12_19235 [Burkholderia sp. Bp9015]RQR80444.1 hypothetical protein DIE10_20205 [Burkholderia sp. Bp9011]RQR89899.1 hypothetical protein DIE09_21650 [Burkholderia sp. Bp9010]RQR97666.1 hypothetical protein DIE04_11690 [Burkholderia sp. Bp8994]